MDYDLKIDVAPVQVTVSADSVEEAYAKAMRGLTHLVVEGVEYAVGDSDEIGRVSQSDLSARGDAVWPLSRNV